MWEEEPLGGDKTIIELDKIALILGNKWRMLHNKDVNKLYVGKTKKDEIIRILIQRESERMQNISVPQLSSGGYILRFYVF